MQTTGGTVDEWADHKPRSQARKQIMKISLKAPTTGTTSSRMSRTKTADPVAKKMVARRRTL